MVTVDNLVNLILATGTNVTNKKLQKLVYYVYAWYYTVYGCKISDLEFQAWVHGPVSVKIYNKYKKYGWSKIPCYRDIILVDVKISEFVKKVLSFYDDFSGDELEEMTHGEEPWKKAREGFDCNQSSMVCINDSDIEEYYVSNNEFVKYLLS